ncbi:hypothetical protein FOZ61_004419 [Perkinsus olseni]|uniref:ABC transporter domain-containing protein n=1 Tax=Perkinsus olseni TaxID=32597 RepID=A0A7J6LZF2_PEROL|nr:hypothetical protein FOZ61_004419 [Perkinsus olseni]KAF4664546.1 hypothetical protein FOL46_004170 [Perkinsus olseni]
MSFHTSIPSSTGEASPATTTADLRKFRSISVGGPEVKGASLEWTDVDFVIKGKKILNSCTGILRPGELTAVLGPSGSGKSTLMNVLGGRQGLRGKGKSFSGEVSFNGKVQDPVNFRSHIAYVMQDDHLTATATPREVLEMSARLRMRDQDEKEIQALVTDLLDSLKLTPCKDTVVGNGVIKGISGGERKRTSVGMELISKPQMIFLDEPLSGLDSYAAVTTMKVLKELARSGVAVMVTVHQPSSEIFSMFDNTLVICSGMMVYQGPTADLKDFFQDNASIKCPPDYNPADFVLSELQTAPLVDIQRLAHVYKKQAEAKIVPAIEKSRVQGSDAPSLKPKARPAAFTTQLRELFLRDARDTFRNKPVLIARYSVLIILNLLFGCVFFDAGSSQSEEYWLANLGEFIPYYGGMVTVCIFAMMGSAQATILRFPEQRGIFLREYASNTYSTIPYMISKMMAEFPLSFVDSVVQIIITYYMMNFQGNIFYWFLTSWVLNISSVSLAQLVGAAVNSGAQAIQMMPVLFVPQMVFSGLFTSLSNIPVWLRWIQWLCALKYGVNLAYFNEFGFDYAQLSEINDAKSSLVGLDIGILLGLIVVLRTATNVVLKRKARYVF